MKRRSPLAGLSDKGFSFDLVSRKKTDAKPGPYETSQDELLDSVRDQVNSDVYENAGSQDAVPLFKPDREADAATDTPAKETQYSATETPSENRFSSPSIGAPTTEKAHVDPAPAAKQQPESSTLYSGSPKPETSTERPQIRSSRVKTTFLGFDRSDGRVEDVFSRNDNSAEAAQTSIKFPVGWLLVTNGPGRGTCITLQPGVSQIGRGEDQAVQLNFGDNSISRENHAAVAFDPEESKFFIGHGGKSNIVRLNGKPVLSTEELNDRDEIRIGETTLRFVALCGEYFSWSEEE